MAITAAEINAMLQSWYAKYMPYGSVNVESIDTGVRSVPYTCQYWLNGLPSVCQNWTMTSGVIAGEEEGDESVVTQWECTYSGTGTPTGYGTGFCDGLGRRDSFLVLPKEAHGAISRYSKKPFPESDVQNQSGPGWNP